MEAIVCNEDAKKKAAYALNMCTVSVSQILDYNDVYVLEQEYDAILNNLNLEVIPKDETLLNILQEILNVISFFRIQKIRRNQQEKAYQQRIKNAIWSAIPNLSVVVSGDPISIAVSLVTQVGTGYMNYRKEKSLAAVDREKAELELEIAAIEQLHALRRELFTTAWRLADKYGYPDAWRLTERQIEQYNQILMGPDDDRKYARLEAIQDKFCAYPPFWYFFAHTALVIATDASDPAIKAAYLTRAKNHFERYRLINKYNILREDQIAASACLEYADLLLLDNRCDFSRVTELIEEAECKAGSANDVFQLCAIAYLRAGQTDKAVRLLKILVNEDYNTISNARILSHLYVTNYCNRNDVDALTHYQILKTRVNAQYLFPLPVTQECDMCSLEDAYLRRQKRDLAAAYRRTLFAFSKMQKREFNRILAVPSAAVDRDRYFDDSVEAIQQRMTDAERALKRDAGAFGARLLDRGIPNQVIDVLNQTVAGVEEFSCFRQLQHHDEIIRIIRMRLNLSKMDMDRFQKSLSDGKLNFEAYKGFVTKYTYDFYTNHFLWTAAVKITEYIETLQNLSAVERYDYELTQFCSKHGLPAPDSYLRICAQSEPDNSSTVRNVFYSYDILGSTGAVDEKITARRERLTGIAKDAGLEKAVSNPEKTAVYWYGEPQFESYLQNECLKIGDEYSYVLKEKTIAIIDDLTRRDQDLLLTVDGIRLISKNDVQPVVPYADIGYSSKNGTQELNLNWPYVYANKNAAIDTLYAVIGKLKD